MYLSCTLFIYDPTLPRYRTSFVFVGEDQMTTWDCVDACNCQGPPYSKNNDIYEKEESACLPACQIDFRLTKHASLSYIEALRWRIVRSIPIISRKFPLQEAQNMRIDLLEFEQKSVVPILRLDHDKFGIRDAGRDLTLLREHEEPIRLNTDD